MMRLRSLLLPGHDGVWVQCIALPSGIGRPSPHPLSVATGASPARVFGMLYARCSIVDMIRHTLTSWSDVRLAAFCAILINRMFEGDRAV